MERPFLNAGSFADNCTLAENDFSLLIQPGCSINMAVMVATVQQR